MYNKSYKACLDVCKHVLPNLPYQEHYDLKSQLSRSSKAIPRLTAEGYGKRHQKAGFQKYLDDALAECNETIVGLEQVRDIYNIKTDLVRKLIEIYDITSRQIYKLREAWNNFKSKK